MREYTPGPWAAEPTEPNSGGEFYWIRGPRGEEIGCVNGPQRGEQEANAGLIALAPAMAEALRKVDAAFSGVGAPLGSATYFHIRNVIDAVLKRLPERNTQ